MNYEGMLEYYRKALSHFRLLGNTSLQNSAQLNLANAYFSLKDTTNARKYYAAALSLARKRADDEIFAACLGNLGSMYAAGGNYSEALKVVGELGRLDPQTVSFSNASCWLRSTADCISSTARAIFSRWPGMKQSICAIVLP